MKRTAVITITEKDDTLDVDLTFNPPLKANDKATPAVDAALFMLGAFVERSEVSTVEEGEE